MDKDFYAVLGVPKNASETEIKKAFHKLARANHPDAHPGDAAAERRFKEATEAHSVLSDTKQRQEYDQVRALSAGPFGKFGRATQGGAAGSFEDLFARTKIAGDAGGLGDLFGGIFGGGRQPGASRAQRGADIQGEVTIDFREAVYGTTVAFQLRSADACKTCQGTGARPGSSPVTCTQCHGSGNVSQTTGDVFSVSQPCPKCHGRGLQITEPCPGCAGSGRASSQRSIQIRVPAGISDGQKIKVAGKGSPGSAGGSTGDLYVVVKVRPDSTFGRRGKHLTVTVPVTFPEACLGAEIEVATLTGTTTIRIPAGTPNGRILRVRGMGITPAKGEPGDLLVTVEVAVPATLSGEARTALLEFQKATTDFRPRDGIGQ